MRKQEEDYSILDCYLLRTILKFTLPIQNKFVIYKSILRPIRSYGVQLWSCAKPTLLKTIQAFQAISQRQITSAPRFVSNHAIRKDPNIETVHNLIETHCGKFHS